ncbi:MAG: hypothetical protein HY689_06155 [Chloroflexi bacterium]|nr:hypothetical protein [Chloroflexota bacterium]
MHRRMLLLVPIMVIAGLGMLWPGSRLHEAGWAASPTPTATPVDPAARAAAERAAQGGPDEVIPGFGGLFLDPQDNRIAYVYLLDPSQQEAADRAARALLGSRAIREVRVLQGRYTMGQLSAWYNRMRDTVWSVKGLVWTDLDERNNRIALGMAPQPGAQEDVEAALAPLGIPREAVHIEVGCPTGAPYMPPPPGDPALKALEVRVEMPSQKAEAGQPVPFRLVVKNASEEPVTLEYGLGSRFVVTRPDGGTVWDSLCGAGGVPLIAKLRTLAPGEELTDVQEATLAGTWQQWDNRGVSVAPGSYRVFGVFATHPDLATAPYHLVIEPAS